jgi:beta-aspartyl-peptidase (threonine type)
MSAQGSDAAAGRIAMAVHGGAWSIPPSEREAHRRGCRAALERGLSVLRGGGSALDAVEAAIRVLEDDGTFDAGRGSFLDEDGEVSLDAGIMDGELLNTGSVAAAVGVPNAISLARAVMDSPHAVIVGAGARRFAERNGVAVCDPADLVHPRELERWRAAGGGAAKPGWASDLFGDTVGAVARDATGHIAAGTSTGGSPGKPKGRVGDSPFIGAGLYADDEAGASSTTGHGELIIPLVWAKESVDLMRAGTPAPRAATAAVTRLDRLEARGGIILIDTAGRIGVAWNTPAMAFASWPAGATEIVDGPNE